MLEAEEYKIYAERMKEQYDRLLTYREKIVNEIDLQEKINAEMKLENQRTMERYSNKIKEKEQEFENLKIRMSEYEQGLKQKEQMIDQRQREIDKRIKSIEKKKETDLIEKKEFDEERSRVRLLQKSVDELQEKWKGEMIEADERLAEANNTLELAKAKDMVAEKNKQQAKSLLLTNQRKENELANYETRLMLENQQLDNKKKDLARERIKLSSQQEALKLAIKEAQRRWQIQTPK